jgi:hypothetical protein
MASKHFRRQPIGWQGESYRHYLAAKGVKTRIAKPSASAAHTQYYAEREGEDAAAKTTKFLKWMAHDGRSDVDDLVKARRNAEQQQVYQEVLRKLDEKVNNDEVTYDASNDFIRQGGPFEDETKDFLDGKVDLPTYRQNVAKRLSVHIDQNRRTLQVTPSTEEKSLKVFEW